MRRMPPDFTVLDLVTEDLYGLWEILERFQEVYPDLCISEAISKARRALEDLLDRGFIGVYTYHPESDELTAQHGEELHRSLAGQESWLTPQSLKKSYIAVLATEAGSAHYYENPAYRALFEGFEDE